MGTASECLELLSPALDMGFLLCTLQGTQIVAEDMYVWDDHELSNREARWGYAQISKDFAVEREQVFLAGVSQGAGLAMELAVSGAIPSAGFAAVIPAISRFESWIPQAAEAARRGLRGWIFVGQQDPRFPAVKDLHQQLGKAELKCLFESMPGVGHDIPPDFPEHLRKGLAFLCGKNEPR